MLKDKQSIQVTIRVRPLSQKQKSQDSRICVDVEQQTRSISTFFASQTKKFSFDSICNNNSQEDIFEKVGKKSTIYCLQGYNCTIFAYGQTGSGKTFTMMGVNQQCQNYQQMRGLIPRTLQYLFDSIDEQMKLTGSRYLINCSFLQIYNQQIIDLLNKNNSNLQIREDIRKGVYVEGITEQTIQKGQEALDILNKGSKQRHVGSTCYNQTSSRSHSVFTMQIQSKHEKNGVINTKVRQFHFIDLAGSERTSNINGDRLKEGCNINKSLMVLGKVINSLVQSSSGKAKHINYRDSKLTFLLKDSLGGNSKTHLIANVSPCLMSYNQTTNTLKFARRVKQIKVNKASINQDATGNLQSLKNQIKRLKQQIILLRNGQITSLQISRRSQRGQIATDTKMALMLNQYVSDQIDRQTKFQIQVSKLSKKVQNLQNAIHKYSENQIQLRMIIKIYQDKVRRLKNIQNQIKQNQNVNSSESSRNEVVTQYLQNQRKLLLNEVQSYKKLTSNQVTIKSFLKSLKLFENDQNLHQVLMKNSQFLSELKNQLKKIQKLKPNSLQDQNQIIENKLAQIDLQYSKKETQYLQRIESLQQMLNQVKAMGQENEQLLKEAVDHQISLQEKNKEQQNQIKQLSQLQAEYIQKINNLQKVCLTLENQKNSLLKANQILKLEKIEFIKTIEQQKVKLSKSQIKWTQKYQQKSQQLFQLQQENKAIKIKIQQLDKTISELYLKTTDLETSNKILKESQAKYQIQFKDLLNNLQQQKAFEILKNVEIEKLNIQIQKSNETLSQYQLCIQDFKQKIQVNQRNYFCLQNQSQFLRKSLNQFKDIIKQKQNQIQRKQFTVKQHQQKKEQLQRQIKKLQHNLTNKELMLQESQKSHNQKVEELMNMIDSMQNSDNQNHQQINNIRISMIKLQQSKQQSEYKLKSQLQKYVSHNTELTETIQNLTAKLKEKQTEFKEQKNKVSELKKEITSIRQSIRLSNIQMQQFKSESNHIKVKYQNATEQNLLLTQKKKQLKKQLNESNKQLQQIKTSLKTLQNESYIKEKTYSIQKDSLQKQLKIKQQKYQNHIKQTQKQKQKLIKQIQSHVSQIENLHKSIQNQKLAFNQTQKSLKEKMDECLVNKQKQILDLKQRNDQIKSELQLSNLECQKTNQQMKCLIQTNKTLISEKESLILDNEKLNTQINAKIASQQYLIANTEQIKNKYQNQLQQLQFQHNGQLDNKNQKIEELNSDIQKLQTQVQNLQKQLLRNKQELKDLSNSLSQSVEQISKSVEQINNMKKQLLNLKEKNQSNNIQIQQFTFQIQNLNKINQNQKKQNQQLKSCIQSKQKQIQQKYQLINQQKCQLINELTQLNLTLQNQKLQSISTETLKLQIKQVQERNLKLVFHIQQLQKQVQTLVQKQKQALVLLQKAQSNIKNLQNQLDLQQKKKKTLQEQYQAKISLLINENQSLLKENKICQSMIKAKQNQIKEIYKEITDLNDSIQKINYEQLLPLRKNISEYQFRLQQEKNRFQLTLEKLNSSEAKLQETVQQLENAKQQACHYRKQVNKSRQENIALLQDLCKTKSDLESFQKENSQFRLTNQSYRSLQSINKALGQKCEELQIKCNQISAQYSELQQEAQQLRFKSEQLQKQKQQIKKKDIQLVQIQKKHNYERQLNANLKNLIQNSENQKRQLSMQLQQKNQFYNQLLQKLAKNQNQAKRVTNSEHYVKTVQLLQKSRCQQVQLKKSYEQLKKNNLKLKQQLSKKQEKIQQIKRKSEQYCKNISKRNQDTENDYMQLQKKYEVLYKEKKVFQKVLLQNQNLKNINNRASLKIEDLQQKLKNLKCDYLQISSQFEEFQKKGPYSGGEQMGYINKLKSQLNDVKRQKQIISASLMKESNQKVMLKSQIRSNNNSQSQIKSELQKRTNQIIFLKQIISQAMQACRMSQIQPEPKLDILKNLFLNAIKQNIKQNQQLKRKIRQLQNQIQRKIILGQKTDAYHKDHREKSNSMFTNLHQKLKQQNQQNHSMIQQNKKVYQGSEQPLCNIMRTKINKTGSKYSQIRQSAEGTVLKSKEIGSNNIINKNYQF